jgi:hypothetical protein
MLWGRVSGSQHFKGTSCLHLQGLKVHKIVTNILPSPLTWSSSLKPGLDGAWLSSFYVITDVIDKESYSNAPCNRPGTARRVIGGARLVGSPQKRFFHDPQRDSAQAALAATQCLQYTRQASLVQACIHLGLVFVFCCRGAWRVKVSVPQLVLARMEWSNEDIFKCIEQHDLFHKPSQTYPSKAAGPLFAELRRVV